MEEKGIRCAECAAKINTINGKFCMYLERYVEYTHDTPCHNKQKRYKIMIKNYVQAINAYKKEAMDKSFMHEGEDDEQYVHRMFALAV